MSSLSVAYQLGLLKILSITLIALAEHALRGKPGRPFLQLLLSQRLVAALSLNNLRI